MKTTIYTIGHSTRSIEEFVALLEAFEIEMVVDVRTIPRSRRNPQYNEDALNASLREVNVSYTRLEELGGLRHTTSDSINTAWNNVSFRGYADYMQTPGFASGIDRLIAIARQQQTVIMCAEAVPWRCHRSLIGDALLVRDIAVEDIISAKSCKPHTLTSFAHVAGETITYPESQHSEDC